MGARADGWWKDRAGAAVRLCEDVAALASRDASVRTAASRNGEDRDGASRNGSVRDGGSRDGGSRDGASRDGVSRNGSVRDGGSRDSGRHWVMVLEGRARAAAADPALNLMDSVTWVSLVLARGSGDDTMAHMAAELGEYCTVVTADRELRRRCERAGASVTGPRWLLGLI
jgi:8-oxo-dGTP diphosphatase